MNWTETIYWLTRLDGISKFFTLLAFIFGVILGTMLIYRGIMMIDDDEYKKKPFLFGLSIFMTIFFGILSILIPTTKEAIFIFSAGKTLNYVTTDSSLTKIPNKVSEITVNWLDAKLKELKTETESNLKK